MKRNWEKDLHDRLGNYEKDAPDGLWEEIHRQMAGTKQRPTRSPRRTLFFGLPMRRVAGVAAAACLALAIGYHFYGDDTDGKDYTATATVASAPKQDGVQRPVADAPRPADLSRQQASSQGRRVATKGQAEQPTETDPRTEEHTAPEPLPTQEEHRRQTEPQQQPVQETDNRHLQAYTDNNRQTRRKGNAASRWSIGTNATAGMGTPQTVRGNGVPLVASSSVAADCVTYPQLGNPQLGVYSNNNYYYGQVQETKTEYTHHLPVRFGLNAAYRLTDRLSIESGLSYTRLSSDLKDGTEESYSTGTQELDYVGIPVNLKYRVLASRHFRLYASAGVLAEQCVSGKVTRKPVLGGTAAQTEEGRVSTKPQQLSANVAVGVQFDLSGDIGIYAEPGLSYYFDDRSSLSTIYKEKPLNFNLNVGLRFTVGK